MISKNKKYLIRILRNLHTILLLGEEGDLASWIIMGSLMMIYLGFSIALIREYGTTLILEYTRYAHDNAAHLYIARSIVDNGRYSRLANVGTVWLPLYHLVIAPLTLIDPLYTTGLAGALFNSVFIATTASIIYLIVKNKIGIIVSIMYGLSAYSLIHSASSYMVPLGQFLSVASLYYSLRYIDTRSIKELTKSVALAMLASTARYEAWLIVASITIVIIIKELRERNWVIVTYIPLLWSGIFGWFIYNWIIFGDPLEFIFGKYPGASGYYLDLINILVHPWRANIKLMVFSMMHLSSIFIALLTFINILIIISYRDNIKNKLSKVILFYLPLSLFIISKENLLISDIPLYFYFASPWLFITNGYIINSLKYKYNMKILYIIVIILLVGSFVAQQYSEYNRININLRTGYNKLYIDEENILKIIKLQKTKGGYIASPISTLSAKISVLGGISPRLIIDSYDSDLYINSSLEPWKENVSVILLPSLQDYLHIRIYINYLSDGKDYSFLFYENETWRNEFFKHYIQVSNIEVNDMNIFIYIKNN